MIKTTKRDCGFQSSTPLLDITLFPSPILSKQHHKLICFEVVLWRLSCPSQCSEQVQSQQVAQGQLHFEYLQGQRILKLAGHTLCQCVIPPTMTFFFYCLTRSSFFPTWVHLLCPRLYCCMGLLKPGWNFSRQLNSLLTASFQHTGVALSILVLITSTWLSSHSI